MILNLDKVTLISYIFIVCWIVGAIVHLKKDLPVGLPLILLPKYGLFHVKHKLPLTDYFGGIYVLYSALTSIFNVLLWNQIVSNINHGGSRRVATGTLPPPPPKFWSTFLYPVLNQNAST